MSCPLEPDVVLGVSRLCGGTWELSTEVSAAAKQGYRYQCGSVLSRLPFELNVERRTALVLPVKAGETLPAFCREARQRELGQMCLADRGVSLWGTLIDLHMPRSFLPDYLSGSDTLSDGVFHDVFTNSMLFSA